MNVNRGDIFYIQRSNSYQGNEIAKDRPGVIVSADHLNAGESCVEVVYLTSQPKKDMNEHVVILSSGRTSTALCEQIYSVTMQRLGNYYGKVSPSEMREIDRALASSIGICVDDWPEGKLSGGG